MAAAAVDELLNNQNKATTATPATTQDTAKRVKQKRVFKTSFKVARVSMWLDVCIRDETT